MKNGFSWLLILGLLLAGCDGDGETDGGTDTDAGDVDAGDDVDAGPGSSGDGNDSFAEADPVTLGEPVMARIDPADAQAALDTARADLSEAEAELRDARRGLELADTVLTAIGPRLEALA